METVLAKSLGEIAEMLDRAGYGELEEDNPESHWRKRGDAGRCKIVAGVAEIRMPSPWYLGDFRFQVRIYYSEPEFEEILVSLGLEGKLEDEPSWKEQQNDAIRVAQGRGDDWAERYLRE